MALSGFFIWGDPACMVAFLAPAVSALCVKLPPQTKSRLPPEGESRRYINRETFMGLKSVTAGKARRQWIEDLL